MTARTIRSEASPSSVASSCAASYELQVQQVVKKSRESKSFDPTIHLARLSFSENQQYAGSGRNIFAVLTEERQEKIFENKKLTPRTSVEWTTNVPLSLRFYGFTMMPNNPPKVFIRDGDALFIATEADIVEYRIERIGTNSLALEDLIEHRAYTLTLPGLPKR